MPGTAGLRLVTSRLSISFVALVVALAFVVEAQATPFVHQTVDAAADVGEFSSLALDAQGRPRISYQDNTNGDLKFASWNGVSWKVEVVDGAATNVGSHTS